jgi:hypothetical protein
MNTNLHWQAPFLHKDLVRWRLSLQKRYAAAELYDELNIEQRRLFNQMAPDFIGTAHELVVCVQAISPATTPASRSAQPSAWA